LAQEQIPGGLDEIASKLEHPYRRQRQAEIEAELRAVYTENGDPMMRT
jgi:hypothetical protein